jgi:hypothetical protein
MHKVQEFAALEEARDTLLTESEIPPNEASDISETPRTEKSIVEQAAVNENTGAEADC